MLVLCVGMYRACSTWQYGVASEILERHGSVQRVGFIDGGPFAASVEPTLESDKWHILKAHDAHDHYAGLLAQGRALAIYGYRDLRDVLFSWMHKTGSEFQEVVDRGFVELCLANDRFWRAQPGLLIQTYEALIANPVQGVQEIATHLGIDLLDGEAEQIAAAHSPEANRKRTSDIAQRLVAQGVPLSSKDQDSYDPLSLLHWNHLRQGQVGGWRDRATPEQMAVMNRLCGEWLLDNQYEPDNPWTRATLANLIENHDRANGLDQTLSLERTIAQFERVEHEQAQAGLREQRDSWQRERDSWQRERDSWQAERDMVQRERDMIQRERDDRQRERDSWNHDRLAADQNSIARLAEAERDSIDRLARTEQVSIDRLAEVERVSIDRLTDHERVSTDRLNEVERASLDRVAQSERMALDRAAESDSKQAELAAEAEHLRESMAREHAWAASDRQTLKAEQARFESDRETWSSEREALQKALELARRPGRAGRLIQRIGLVTSLYHRAGPHG